MSQNPFLEVKTQRSKIKTTTQNPKSELKIRAFYFSLAVIRFCESLNIGTISRILINQLVRAATSIGANIVEAKSSSSRKDFIKYYEISLKSANETKYWLCLVRETNKERVEETNVLLTEAKELSNILGSSLLTLKGKKF